MINLLQNCKGDIIAANLAITDERKQFVSFSDSYLTTKMVLIQRKPEGYKKMKSAQIQDSLVTEITDLRGKTIHVWKNSTFFRQINYLNIAYDLDMTIVGTEGDLITEELIRQVSEGEIDYTIADENVASIDLKSFNSNNDRPKKEGEGKDGRAYQKAVVVKVVVIRFQQACAARPECAIGSLDFITSSIQS